MIYKLETENFMSLKNVSVSLDPAQPIACFGR